MKKTIKVIDIANKIENGEIKLPVTYKIIDLKHGIYDHIEFYDSKKAYWKQNNSSRIVTFDDLFKEVEIIEEDNDIDLLEIEIENEQSNNCYIRNEHGTKCFLTKHSKILANKLNEVIREINKLKEGN